MKKILSFFAMLILVSIFTGSLMAQPQYYNYNAGGSANSFPWNQAAGKMVQTLITPGEFNQPSPAPEGNILGVSFWISSYGLPTTTYTDLKILMGQTTDLVLPTGAFYTGTMTEVYNKPTVALTGTANSWMDITLDVPFTYNPAQSLVIQIEQRGASGGTSGIFSTSHTSTTARRSYSVGGYPFVYSGISNYVIQCGITISGVGINGFFNNSSDVLLGNYPNPCSQQTVVFYQLPENSHVNLKVTDVMGKEIATLVNTYQTAGKYEVNFNTSALKPGMYFYQLITDKQSQTNRLMVE